MKTGWKPPRPTKEFVFVPDCVNPDTRQLNFSLVPGQFWNEQQMKQAYLDGVKDGVNLALAALEAKRQARYSDVIDI